MFLWTNGSARNRLANCHVFKFESNNIAAKMLQIEAFYVYFVLLLRGAIFGTLQNYYKRTKTFDDELPCMTIRVDFQIKR